MSEVGSKVAVVTGGASGIGLAIAERLLADGLQVMIADIEAASLKASAERIGAAAHVTDVSSQSSMQALADAVMAQFGRVDLVCINAGVGSSAPIADMTRSDWDWMLGVNLFGLVNGVHAFLPLLEATGGHLAVTTSVAGFHVTPGLGGYCVTKFAATAYCETLAMELEAKGSTVGVTVLCPGPVSTRLGSSHRNRPAALGAGALRDANLEQSEDGATLRWMPPAQAADLLMRAIADRQFYAFTHGEFAGEVYDRHERIRQGFDWLSEKEG